MNDTYGLPIIDITCWRPVCLFRPVGPPRGFSKDNHCVCERRTGRGSEKLDDPHTIAYNGKCKQPVAKKPQVNSVGR